MEPVIVSTYAEMNARLGCSTDDIAFDPAYRREFLDGCRRSLGSETAERELLQKLANLRKRSKLPRSKV